MFTDWKRSVIQISLFRLIIVCAVQCTLQFVHSHMQASGCEAADRQDVVFFSRSRHNIITLLDTRCLFYEFQFDRNNLSATKAKWLKGNKEKWDETTLLNMKKKGKIDTHTHTSARSRREWEWWATYIVTLSFGDFKLICLTVAIGEHNPIRGTDVRIDSCRV